MDVKVPTHYKQLIICLSIVCFMVWQHSNGQADFWFFWGGLGNAWSLHSGKESKQEALRAKGPTNGPVLMKGLYQLPFAIPLKNKNGKSK